MCLMIQVAELVAEGQPKSSFRVRLMTQNENEFTTRCSSPPRPLATKSGHPGKPTWSTGNKWPPPLAELGIEDADTIIAALLHDVLQPFTNVFEKEVANRFGHEVTSLIKGINTLDNHSKDAGRKWLETKPQVAPAPTRDGLKPSARRC